MDKKPGDKELETRKIWAFSGGKKKKMSRSRGVFSASRLHAKA